MRQWIYKSMSDEALMRAYSKGQVAAFECLYRRHRNRLFAFLRRQCGNPAVAEDLAHDTWMAVINQAGGYRSSARFTSWIFRIAHNRLVDHWRKHGNSVQPLLQEVSDALSTADNSTQGLELAELLKNLQILPSEQIETLLLKIEGFSHAEIADITGSKQETVKSRLRYATKALRTSMEVQL